MEFIDRYGKKFKLKKTEIYLLRDYVEPRDGSKEVIVHFSTSKRSIIKALDSLVEKGLLDVTKRKATVYRMNKDINLEVFARVTDSGLDGLEAIRIWSQNS